MPLIHTLKDTFLQAKRLTMGELGIEKVSVLPDNKEV
jgi:hypothetical protein